jgi:hypothetical protein
MFEILLYAFHLFYFSFYNFNACLNNYIKSVSITRYMTPFTEMDSRTNISSIDWGTTEEVGTRLVSEAGLWTRE